MERSARLLTSSASSQTLLRVIAISALPCAVRANSKRQSPRLGKPSGSSRNLLKPILILVRRYAISSSLTKQSLHRDKQSSLIPILQSRTSILHWLRWHWGECQNPVRLSRKPSSLRRIKPSIAAILAISQSTKTATLIWSQWNNCCKTVPGFPLMTGYIYILRWPRPMTTLAGMQKRFANGSPAIRSSGSILPTMRQRCWRHLIVHRQYSLPIWSALGKTAACHQRCRSSSWGCPAQALL